MSALRKPVVLETEPVVETPATWTPVVITNTAARTGAEAAPARRHGLITNMALFLSAPFIGLLYAVLLPFVGLGMLLWFGGKALFEPARVKRALRFARKYALPVAAPFLGLAYLIVLPFAGLAMLAWFGGKAVLAPARAA